MFGNPSPVKRGSVFIDTMSGNHTNDPQLTVTYERRNKKTVGSENGRLEKKE